MNRFIIKDLFQIIDLDWKLKTEFRFLSYLNKYIRSQNQMKRIEIKQNKINEEIWNLQEQLKNLQSKSRSYTLKDDQAWINITKLLEKGVCPRSISGHHSHRQVCEYCSFDIDDIEHNFRNDDYYYDTYIR